MLVAVARAAIGGSILDADQVVLDAADWEMLAGEAEASRLAPLVHASLEPHRGSVPESAMRQIDALALRHHVWHRARTAALVEILRTLERMSIDALVFKGGALAWTIYPSPALRPMSDVDILVPDAAATAAQGALVGLGFRAERTARRFGKNAHHLPIATRQTNGLPISVEIHRSAISRDTCASISMATLTEPPGTFMLDGEPARTLGHLDTLRQLTHHLVEPSWDGRVRLLGLVDLLRYAAIFHDRIDWERLHAEHPWVVNALACVHLVTPLPPALARFAPPAGAAALAGTGEIIRPLRAVLTPRQPVTAMVRELLDPPAWWLHAYYGIPPDAPLAGARLVRHPWRVVRWLGLRLAGA